MLRAAAFCHRSTWSWQKINSLALLCLINTVSWLRFFYAYKILLPRPRSEQSLLTWMLLDKLNYSDHPTNINITQRVYIYVYIYSLISLRKKLQKSAWSYLPLKVTTDHSTLWGNKCRVFKNECCL